MRVTVNAHRTPHAPTPRRTPIMDPEGMYDADMTVLV